MTLTLPAKTKKNNNINRHRPEKPGRWLSNSTNMKSTDIGEVAQKALTGGAMPALDRKFLKNLLMEKGPETSTWSQAERIVVKQMLQRNGLLEAEPERAAASVPVVNETDTEQDEGKRITFRVPPEAMELLEKYRDETNEKTLNKALISLIHNEAKLHDYAIRTRSELRELKDQVNEANALKIRMSEAIKSFLT